LAGKLLDPLVIVQLGNLHIRARRILDGLYSGYHTTPYRGSSQEFSEHRAYYPGDDPKNLDWKALARADRLVIKQYEEETNVAGWILLDDSASMNFSAEGRPSKLEYAKTLAAALGYLLTFQHDAVGLATQKIILNPESGRGHLEHFIANLSPVQGGGIWDIKAISNRMSAAYNKRTFVFVFSDLMANDEEIIQSVRFLAARKNEVMVFQILDPAEINLPWSGPMWIEDSETNEKLKTDPEIIRSKYQAVVKNHLESFANVFRSQGVDYLLLQTDTPFNKGLGVYLSKRGQHL